MSRRANLHREVRHGFLSNVENQVSSGPALKSVDVHLHRMVSDWKRWEPVRAITIGHLRALKGRIRIDDRDAYIRKQQTGGIRYDTRRVTGG